jgi:short-subunit dehydrogenase
LPQIYLKKTKMNVIITGGTKGIGRAIAEKFAAEGHNIITCSRHQNDLDEMVEAFKNAYPAISLKVKVVDLEDANQVKAFGTWILDSDITPGILINNAGYFIPGTVYAEPEGTLQKMMEINVYSAYHLTRLLLPAMIKNKSGHIFNICSVASFKGSDNVGSYGISKFALLGLTKHLREEMKPYGIKVTAISPGSTLSASWEGVDVEPNRIMDIADVAKMVFVSSQLSLTAVVEDIIMRPQLGDL